MFDANVSWINDILRSILAFIDMIVYSVISILFRAVFNLANFELVGFYEVIEERVFVVLGIFMLFKITISMISYLVNPDKISDKEQGASKVVVRIITVLIMLIGLPSFYGLMTEAQNVFLPVIPRIIMGTANTLSSDDAAGIADNMSSTMLSGFASLKDECKGSSNLGEIDSPSALFDNINLTCKSGNGKIYAYKYLPIVSTIVGIAMCYVIYSLCISVAIRAFKLIILRMLAPIPVMSYIDPKSSKDGAFSHWTKTFISTWLELFINLGIIYFIVYIIDFLLSGDAWIGFFDGIGDPLDGILLLAFVIIGLLFFAKSAPQFVMDALGIKSKGNFMRMLGMGAAAAGIGGSAISAYRASAEADPNRSFLRNAGAGLFSGIRSGIAGGSALMDEKGTISSGIDAQSKFNKSNIGMIEKGATLPGRLSAFGQNLLLGETEADRYDRRLKRVADYEKILKDHKGVVESRFDGSDDFVYSSSAWRGDLNFNVVKRMVEASKGDPASAATAAANSWLRTNQVDVAEFLAKEDEIHKEGYQQYIDNANDAVVINSEAVTKNALKGAYVYEYDSKGKVSATHNLDDINLKIYGTKDPITGNPALGIKTGLAQTSTETSQIKSSQKYSKAQANKQASGS